MISGCSYTRTIRTQQLFRNSAILSNVNFLTFNFLAFKFTGFGLGLGLRLKHRICKKATLDKKAKNSFNAGGNIKLSTQPYIVLYFLYFLYFLYWLIQVL